MTQSISTRPVAAPTIVELPSRSAAVVRVAGAGSEFPRLLGDAFGLTAGAIAASGATIAGPPFTRYLAFGERIEAEVGFPFASSSRVGASTRRSSPEAGRSP